MGKQFDLDHGDDVYSLIAMHQAVNRVMALDDGDIDLRLLLEIIEVFKLGPAARVLREGRDLLTATGTPRPPHLAESIKFAFRIRLALERISDRLNDLTLMDRLGGLDESLEGFAPALAMMSRRDYVESIAGFPALDLNVWWGRKEWVLALIGAPEEVKHG